MRATIIAGLMPTPRAHLRGMSRVNSLDSYPVFLCFVGSEGVQVGKGPTVKLALVINVLVLFASAHVGCVSNVGEVLKDEGTARGGILDKATREDVIAIPVESLLPLAQLLQVTLCGLCSFGLQLTAYAKVTTVNLFPIRRTKELTSARDCWPVQTQVNANHGIIFRHNCLRNSYHDMQPPFPLTVDEVCCSYWVACILSTEVRDREGNTHLPLRRRDADHLPFPVERIGMNIVPNWTEPTLRTLDWLELWERPALLLGLGNFLLIGGLMLGFPGKGTLERFSSFDASLYQMIGDQSRTRSFRIIVQRMMQFHAVLFAVLPSVGTHLIKSGSELSKRLLQGVCLLRGRMQLYSHSSVHTKSIPYMSKNCKCQGGKRQGAWQSRAGFYGEVAL